MVEEKVVGESPQDQAQFLMEYNAKLNREKIGELLGEKDQVELIVLLICSVSHLSLSLTF